MRRALAGEVDAAREGHRLADVVAGLVGAPPGAAVVRNGSVRLVPAAGGLLPHLTVLQNMVRAHRVARGQVPPARAAEACRVMAGSVVSTT